MSEKLDQNAASGSESDLPQIATYRRALPVSLERVYENAVDWAHLPYLHSSTFARIDCLQAGEWGFRARVWPRARPDGQSVVIELRLDRQCCRWITRTLEGPGRRTEIRTRAFPAGERHTDVVVDFFVPRVAQARIKSLQDMFVELYTTLYDEDVSMMTVRQQQLDGLRRRQFNRRSKLELGSLDDLRKALPAAFELDGRSFRLVELNN